MVFEVKPIVFEAALSSHSSVRRCAGQHAAKAAALTLGNPLESADEAPASIGVQLKEDRYVETQQKDAQTHETAAGQPRQKAEAVTEGPRDFEGL